MTIQIPYKPRKWAEKLHQSKKRWNVLILHRRAGKSYAAINHLQRDAVKIPNSRWAYIAPTYKQAKNIAWDILKHFSRPIPDVVPNEQELSVKYPNGSKITLYGADNPDSLRGIALWGVVFDEYSQQPANIFGEIISKALADHLGYAIWIGTIKGKNHLFRLYDEGKKDQEKWLAIWQDIDETLRTENDEAINNLRQALEDDKKLVQQGLMTEEEFLQEWYLSTEAAIKGAYYTSYISKARKENRIKLVPHNPAHPVYTVWDLGKGPNMAVGFFQRIEGEMRMIDCLEGALHEAMPEVISHVLKKPYTYGAHFAPHDIKHTEIATGKTRLDIALGLGIEFQVVPEVSVNDGIERVKLMWNRFWINEMTCQLFLDAITQYRREWDENRGMFKEQPYHDWTSHFADVLRYAALVEDQMYVVTQKKKSYQIQFQPTNEYDLSTVSPNAGSSHFTEDL